MNAPNILLAASILVRAAFIIFIALLCDTLLNASSLPSNLITAGDMEQPYASTVNPWGGSR